MRCPWRYELHLIPYAQGELFCCSLLEYYAVIFLPRRWYDTLQEMLHSQDYEPKCNPAQNNTSR